MTEIVELKDFIPAYTNAVQKLLEQLTNRPVKLTETTDMIAKTILEQIGGRRFAAMTGSKDFK